MFLVHLFLLLFMWWCWGIVSPPAVSPAGTEQSYLTLPQEYFQQHFKSIINFIFIKSIIEVDQMYPARAADVQITH